MNDDLGAIIDTWLRTQPRWVTSAEIEEMFGVSERRLRFDGGKPGLLSFNCISHSQHGYKHVRHATEAEWTESNGRDFKTVRARCFVLRKRRQRRREERTCIPIPMEPATGQLLLA